jgi:hypothetical protein
MCLFRGTLINKPESLLESYYKTSDRIEHYFWAFNSVNIIFIEVDKYYVSGKARLDLIGQVLAECLGMLPLRILIYN